MNKLTIYRYILYSIPLRLGCFQSTHLSNRLTLEVFRGVLIVRTCHDVLTIILGKYFLGELVPTIYVSKSKGFCPGSSDFETREFDVEARNLCWIPWSSVISPKRVSAEPAPKGFKRCVSGQWFFWKHSVWLISKQHWVHGSSGI